MAIAPIVTESTSSAIIAPLLLKVGERNKCLTHVQASPSTQAEQKCSVPDQEDSRKPRRNAELVENARQKCR